MNPFNKEHLKLYLVTDRDIIGSQDIIEVVKQAVEGGVTMVQLREKHACTREFVALGRRLVHELIQYNVPLIVNDRIDVAIAIHAAGVHLGQSDMPYNMARYMLGPDKIIGMSVEDMTDVTLANSMDVDYIAASPVFPTTTKTDTHEPFGLEGLREVVKESIHPVVGIGGMNAYTAADVMQCGADGIAVVSAILEATDAKKASHDLLKIVNQNRKR